MPVNLLLLDDHAMFREGLALALERQPDLRVTGQFAAPADALAGLAASAAGMVLLGANIGSDRGLEFVTAARRRGYTGKILVLTAGLSDQEAVHLVQAGVAGIMHKQHSTEELCQAIRKVTRGEVWLEEKYLGPLFRSVDRTRPPARPKLRERDRMVLRYILQGLTNRQIADRLEVTEGAIKASLRQLFARMNVRTRAQLVKVAMEQYRDQL
jgi:two-component system nitrate/nitrite response regulator NarL